MTMSNNNGMTKVFVGGLAWETPKESLKSHFDKYGEILEAVIISDKVTGRSKGYGFVTFKDAEAAKKACEDATPIINGRRANCNLAALGARRPRSSSATPPKQGVNVGPRATSTAHANHVQWYYPAGAPTPPPFHHHQQHHQSFPVYGYSPTYIATYMNYNHKHGHFSQVYPAQPMMNSNALMPMYPLYHFHQSHAVGLPAHIYSPTTAGPIPTVPALISKTTSLAAPNSVCLAVE
ncbi:probable RNA-binding protein ARP1 isoform X2 [Olea europaea var. sylvestris]|uniref:probable RNA-binding protein ARP1 isoform X2 n=1 Tax=Olea europaea var. sylvestris TaxID=158386 RepID=UPI000C1D28B7|nr:probable RNA-binding protein ARP1 isoform X2 [Olea europaea var. sylvestris]